MVVDRIERHDVVNAVLLAGVLLVLGFAIVSGTRMLLSTLDDGLIESAKPTSTTLATDDGAGGATDGSAVAPVAREPGEVSIRVGNGSGRSGLAGSGSDTLQAAGYQTLPPKNASPLEKSVVYFAEGYSVDAEKVAAILGVDAAFIEPMPAEPGVEVDGANIVVILGANSQL